MAALAAVVLSVAGCTLPLPQGKSGNNHNITIPSPSPSPSPSPTQQVKEFAFAGPAFHPGEVGVAYAPVVYSASGGVAPYQWSVSAGALPPGLVLNDGTVSGTPTSSGTYPFTLEVVDSGPNKGDVPVSIKVVPALSVSLLPACAKYCAVELGCANACGNFGQQTGGLGPFNYKLVQGQVPSGTSLSTLSLKGTFGGLTGFLQFTVQVTDALGGAATVSPTFWMYPHIALASGGCSTFYGTACQTQLKISGGIPNDHFTVKVLVDGPPAANQGCGSPGPVPVGSIGVSGSNVVINVPGTWPGTSGYGAIWTLQVTDSALCAPSTNCMSNQATAVVEVQCG